MQIYRSISCLLARYYIYKELTSWTRHFDFLTFSPLSSIYSCGGLPFHHDTTNTSTGEHAHQIICLSASLQGKHPAVPGSVGSTPTHSQFRAFLQTSEPWHCVVHAVHQEVCDNSIFVSLSAQCGNWNLFLDLRTVRTCIVLRKAHWWFYSEDVTMQTALSN